MSEHEDPLPDPTRDEVAGLLSAWLPAQRWFGGKGHPLTSVVVTDAVGLPRGGDAAGGLEGAVSAVESTLARLIDLRGLPEVLHLVVGVRVDDVWQTYQIPVCLYSDGAADDDNEGPVRIGELSDGRVVVDALTDTLGMTALLLDPSDVPVLDPAETHGRPPTAGGTRAPTFEAVHVDPAWVRLPPRRLSVEQSNTSIVIGESALVKVFRRLVPGTNPDIEVHAALQGNTHLGRCLGWVNGGWHDPAGGQWRTGHLAMVQQLLAPAVDGWELACQRVAAGVPFAAEARALGVATASVHADLRAVFPTEQLGPDDRGALVERLLGRLDAAAAQVPQLTDLAPALRARVAALGDVPGAVEVQRVHGDYHLGQVLLAGDGWKLLDFEGEPGAEVAARTAADHPLRDVAGMLRSFAYAAAQGGGGRSPAEVAAWSEDCQRAFLAGYTAGSESGDADGPGLGPDARTILTAYLVDKAAYEALYEKRNRPDWLRIPLDALAQLAE
jgi:maltokinase